MQSGKLFWLSAKQDASARILYEDYLASLEEGSIEENYPLSFSQFVAQSFREFKSWSSRASSKKLVFNTCLFIGGGPPSEIVRIRTIVRGPPRRPVCQA